jgi:FkbM family methyltransferase
MSYGPAVQHWHDLVEQRRLQMDAAYAELRRTSADFWARRAGAYRRYAGLASEKNRLIQRTLALLPPGGSVLEVGAGTGRYALSLAQNAGLVIAVEPSPEMAGVLREDALAHGIVNVEVREAGWPEAAGGIEQVDVVLCANVLYPHADIEGWLRSLEAKAGVAVVLEMMVDWAEPQVLLDLWQQFHGAPRVLQPNYYDVYTVLHELGIPANVEVYPTAGSRFWQFKNMDAAVNGVREHLILPPGDEFDAVLREALAEALVEADGALILPSERAAAAIWWERDGPRLRQG